MFKWKTIIPGIVIALIIILSSVPLVSYDLWSSDPASEYCTATHSTDESGCKTDKAHNCVWCIAKAVKSMCYDHDVAQQLPHSVFKCDLPSLFVDFTEVETI